jgi:hypothetical protein
MRSLLDENIPFALRKLLGDREVKHTSEEGWDGLSNGELIAAAEGAGYDVMLTADKNLRYQQNLAARQLPSWRSARITGRQSGGMCSSSSRRWRE